MKWNSYFIFVHPVENSGEDMANPEITIKILLKKCISNLTVKFTSKTEA